MTGTVTLAVDIAEATTELAMARVALTAAERTERLTMVMELTGWALAEPAAKRLWNEARHMLG